MCVFVLLFLGYALVIVPQPRRSEIVDGPPIRGDSRIQLVWMVVDDASTVLCLAGFGTYELVQNGAGGGQGPNAAFQPAGYTQGDRRPGDRRSSGSSRTAIRRSAVSRRRTSCCPRTR